MDGKCLEVPYDHDRQGDGTYTAKGPQQQLTVVGIDTRQVYFCGRKADAEGSVAHQVLERFDLDGPCVLADSLHTQRGTAELILEGGADYVFVVKGIQPSLLARLEAYDCESLQRTTNIDLKRERIETRTIKVATDLASIGACCKSVNCGVNARSAHRYGPKMRYCAIWRPDFCHFEGFRLPIRWISRAIGLLQQAHRLPGRASRRT